MKNTEDKKHSHLVKKKKTNKAYVKLLFTVFFNVEQINKSQHFYLFIFKTRFLARKSHTIIEAKNLKFMLYL